MTVRIPPSQTEAGIPGRVRRIEPERDERDTQEERAPAVPRGQQTGRNEDGREPDGDEDDPEPEQEAGPGRAVAVTQRR